jgi:hypothetical protein
VDGMCRTAWEPLERPTNVAGGGTGTSAAQANGLPVGPPHGPARIEALTLPGASSAAAIDRHGAEIPPGPLCLVRRAIRTSEDPAVASIFPLERES